MTAAICVCALLTAEHVCATIVTPAEFSELVSAARAIAHGRIVGIRAQSSADRVRVETLVTMQVATYLKGNLGPEVTFVVPGGTLGRYRSIILGAPHVVEGEEVVVFLSARGPSLPYVLRLGQGIFRVVRDSRSEDRMIAPPPLVGQSQEWQTVVRGDPARGPMSLTDFAARVRVLVEGGR